MSDVEYLFMCALIKVYCFREVFSELQASPHFQYFGHLMRRVDSLETTLMLGGIGGRRRRG